MPENEPNGGPAAQPDAAAQRATLPGDPSSATGLTAQPGASASGDAPEPQTLAQDEAVRDPIAKARAEAEAKYRTQLREAQKLLAELQAEKKAREEADLSELEKAQRRLAEYEQERAQLTTATQERITRAEVRGEATRLGLNPQLAAKLIDYAAIEYDENGDPQNIAALIQQAAQEYGIPFAASAASSSSAPQGAQQAQPPRPSAGAPAAPARSATTAGNGLTREIIERMSQREIMARMPEIHEWLRTHPNG